MTDKELLELAAKAAGIEIASYHHTKGISVMYRGKGMAIPYFWNPLADDGDALRLAVKLGMNLIQFLGFIRVEVKEKPDSYELHNDDPYAATRRAIVRAAAEIGKAST